MGASAVERTRKKFVEGGLEFTLGERPRLGGFSKLDGHQQAYLTALACSDPPEGRKQWTMQLLAEKLVELEVIDSVGDETAQRMLKKGP